ncbi:MAG: T9SS type A sorting domain-containing protein [Flavobacteriales bacterium]
MNVRVFPSPVTDRLSVQLDGTEVRTVDLEIFDMLGQQVRVESGLPSSGFTLDRGNIKAGLYTMAIRDLNGRLLYIRTIPFAP